MASNQANKKPAPIKLTKGERTAKQIMDTAERLFSEKGYPAVSLREIAAEVGIQEPGLYRHFQNKEALYQQVLERGLKPIATLLQDLLKNKPSVTQLNQLPSKTMDLLAAHPHLAQLFQQTINQRGQPKGDLDFWLIKLLRSGIAVQQKGYQQQAQIELVLKVINLFNVCTGYFSASGLIEELCGRAATDSELIEIEKKLLQEMTHQWRPTRNKK